MQFNDEEGTKFIRCTISLGDYSDDSLNLMPVTWVALEVNRILNDS